jgi:hypothetical protein
MVSIKKAVEESATFNDRMRSIAAASDAQGSFQFDYSALRQAMASAVIEACAEKSGYTLGIKPANGLYDLYTDFAKRGLIENTRASIDGAWYDDLNALRALAHNLPVDRAKSR